MAEKIQDILANVRAVTLPAQDAETLVAETRNLFRRNTGRQDVRRGRKHRDYWVPESIFLLRQTDPDFFPSAAEREFLLSEGFGYPRQERRGSPFQISRNWTYDQMVREIIALYPNQPLELVGISFARCLKGRKVIPIKAASVAELQNSVKKSQLIVIPGKTIPLKDDTEEDTHEMLGSTTLNEDLLIEMSTDEDFEVERPGRTQNTLSLAASSVGITGITPAATPASACSVHIPVTTAPTVTRASTSASTRRPVSRQVRMSRRRAYTQARRNIHSWTGRRSPYLSPSATVTSGEAEILRPLPRPTATVTSAEAELLRPRPRPTATVTFAEVELSRPRQRLTATVTSGEAEIWRPLPRPTGIATSEDMQVLPSVSQQIQRYDELFVLDDEDSEEEAPEPQAIHIPNTHEGISVDDVLIAWRAERLSQDFEDVQYLRVVRRADKLWDHALTKYSSASFALNKTLKIEFRFECGADGGGLMREFCEILQNQMVRSKLLRDTGSGFEPTANSLQRVRKHYRGLGRMLASILLQGGALRPVLSHAFVRYAIQGETQFDECDYDTQRVIERVRSTKDCCILMLDDEVIKALGEAGIESLITVGNREEVCEALRQSSLAKKQKIWDDVCAGAEELGLLTLLREHEVLLESLFCAQCSTRNEITAEELLALIEQTPIGEPESNLRHAVEDTAMYFEMFLSNCQDGEISCKGDKIEVKRVLRFITGADAVPTGGFDSRIAMCFTEGKGCPKASTCTLQITLPVYWTSYEEFCTIMIESLISGEGFDLV